MKIVHVINTGGAQFLGNERHALNLAVAQKARGFSTMLVTDRPGRLADAHRQQDIPVVVAAGMDQGAQVARQETVRGLMTQFRDFGADLIHCHNLRAAAAAIPAANQSRIPCVFTLHIGAAEVMPYYDMAKRSDMRFTTITVCRREFEYLRKTGMSEREVHYVPNGTQAMPLERPAARESGRPNLTLVTGLRFNKGVDIAILAMYELRRRRGPDCPILNVYGEGGQEQYFKEMVQVLRLGDIVHFRGFKLDILAHCANTDVLVMPSRGETGPLVVQEAMSRGMAIVASDVGEVTEMLPDARYGRVVADNSIVALADGVEAMLSDIAGGRFDPRLLVDRHQSLYTIEKMAEGVEAVYEQVRLNSSLVGLTSGE